MRTHGRTRVLIGALLALAFAMVIPTTAMAGHDLGIYKVEKHIDLDSDDFEVTLSCYPGDYAMDGMWRIDHADYDEDDDYITFLGRSVDVEMAYPLDTAIDPDSRLESYYFKFNKNAIGRAQLKVFATCLKSKTEVDGHQHDIVLDTPQTQTLDADGSFTSPTCGPNKFVSQPGYKINRFSADPVPFVGHMSTSWPLNIGQWRWVIDISQDPGTTVDFYWTCTQRKVPLAGGEKHKLVYRLQGPENHSIPAKKVKTKRIECKSHYKAIVAGFSFIPGSMAEPNTDDFPGLFVPHLWFLGMDPQPKNRDFKFLNSDVAPHPVDLKAICLNYRTT